uniref:Uncharacterized protein n=1 Tax=Brassica oleracea var. oleracea TaxID=109376 RepID=A0A0D3BDC6_BRAOL
MNSSHFLFKSSELNKLSFISSSSSSSSCSSIVMTVRSLPPLSSSKTIITSSSLNKSTLSSPSSSSLDTHSSPFSATTPSPLDTRCTPSSATTSPSSFLDTRCSPSSATTFFISDFRVWLILSSSVSSTMFMAVPCKRVLKFPMIKPTIPLHNKNMYFLSTRLIYMESKWRLC